MTPTTTAKGRKPTITKAAPPVLPAVEARPFQKGQKWRLPNGHAEILHIGRTLVQYRFIKIGMVRGALEMKSIANFAEALKAHKAELVV